MPKISRLFVKFGLIYFVVSLLLALFIGVHAHYPIASWITLIGPTYLHLFMVGWITQIIFGIAIWFFPRFTKEKPRGREWLNYLCLISINLGLILRVLAEPIHAAASTTWTSSALVLSAILQFIAGLAFAITIWPRVKGK